MQKVPPLNKPDQNLPTYKGSFSSCTYVPPSSCCVKTFWTPVCYRPRNFVEIDPLASPVHPPSKQGSLLCRRRVPAHPKVSEAMADKAPAKAETLQFNTADVVEKVTTRYMRACGRRGGLARPAAAKPVFHLLFAYVRPDHGRNPALPLSLSLSLSLRHASIPAARTSVSYSPSPCHPPPHAAQLRSPQFIIFTVLWIVVTIILAVLEVHSLCVLYCARTSTAIPLQKPVTISSCSSHTTLVAP